MCLSVASLNSGSNGNCYYISGENEAVLVDIGISCKEIEKRMSRLGLSIEKIKAIFITHEHTDHIYGLTSFLKKYPVPVFITSNIILHGINIPGNLLCSFKAHESIKIGDLSITAFPKWHDAADPFSFVIRCKAVTVGVFTDMGFACNNVVHYFRQCHAAFLETNYDTVMLHNGSYPFILKKRISGNKGHLSNMQALELFLAYKPAFMTHLFLAHLSHNNNSVEIVEQLFNTHANGVKAVVATRFKETEVYNITAIHEPVLKFYPSPLHATQLSFGF